MSHTPLPTHININSKIYIYQYKCRKTGIIYMYVEIKSDLNSKVSDDERFCTFLVLFIISL